MSREKLGAQDQRENCLRITREICRNGDGEEGTIPELFQRHHGLDLLTEFHSG